MQTPFEHIGATAAKRRMAAWPRPCWALVAALLAWGPPVQARSQTGHEGSAATPKNETPAVVERRDPTDKDRTAPVRAQVSGASRQESRNGTVPQSRPGPRDSVGHKPHDGPRCRATTKNESILVVSSADEALLGRKLKWGRPAILFRSAAKLLLSNRCVVRVKPGTRLLFVRTKQACGSLLLLAGELSVWPTCPMVVATKTKHFIVDRPAHIAMDPTGPKMRGLRAGSTGYEPAGRAVVALPLDIDALLPRPGGRSGGPHMGGSGSVAAVGGGSMCLDTSAGSGSAGGVQQGPTTIQKPTAKARVILHVEVDQ